MKAKKTGDVTNAERGKDTLHHPPWSFIHTDSAIHSRLSSEYRSFFGLSAACRLPTAQYSSAPRHFRLYRDTKSEYP